MKCAYSCVVPAAVNQLRVRVLPAVRRWRDRLDAPEIRQARMLAKRAREARPDVLYLSDSMAYFVSPKDSDVRQLRQMLADELEPELSVLTIGGGGYHPRMFASYARLYERVAHRPIIIVPLSVRITDSAWLHHPGHGHPRATVQLEQLRGRPAWRMRAMSSAPVAADMRRHDRRPHPSFAGDDLTIADYRRQLKDPAAAGLDHDAQQKLLYAFHHTHALQPGDDGLVNMTAMAATLREMNFPVVPYETPIPVQRGVEMFGPEFRTLAQHNLELMDDAFRRGYPEADIVATGTIFETGEFLDPEDGSEHLNEIGRRKLLDAIVTQVRALHSVNRSSAAAKGRA